MTNFDCQKEIEIRETASHRVQMNASGCTTAELLTALIGGPKAKLAAHHLIAEFSSAYGLSKTTSEELLAVPNVGSKAAASICAAFELARRANVENPAPHIRSPNEAANLFKPHLMNKDQEHLFVLALNTRNKVIRDPYEVYKGSLNSSLIRIAEIFRAPIKINAAAIIVAHNHPSGDPTPSPDDVAVTKAIKEAGKLLDIELLDHLVIAGDKFISLKERALGF